MKFENNEFTFTAAPGELLNLIGYVCITPV